MRRTPILALVRDAPVEKVRYKIDSNASLAHRAKKAFEKNMLR